MRNIAIRGLLVLGAALVLVSSGYASTIITAPTITVGNYVLLPNTPNQTIQIFVGGNVPVQGVNFRSQVADGGPQFGGTQVGPHITNVDILTGTIFADPNNTGSVNPGSGLQYAERRTSTPGSSTVNTSGLLATLTIDTSGFSSGVYPLNLSGTVGHDTNFGPIAASITNGTISVPEPASLALTGLALAGLLARRRNATKA